MFLAITSLVFADSVQVGSGTSRTDRLPVNTSNNYSYSQQIFPQAQINRSGTIERIRFYFVEGDISHHKNWVIYMGHTSRTTFDGVVSWIPVSSMTQVFAGDVSSYVPAPNNWMEIPLDASFAYNNIENLVIAVDENTPGMSILRWGSYYTGESGVNTSILYHDATVNPDPASPPQSIVRFNFNNRIQLSFTNTEPPAAPILISPATGNTVPVWEELVWAPGSGVGDATAYDVYLDTENGYTVVASDHPQTSYAPELDFATTYYWKVVAKNSVGSSPPSARRVFTTLPDNSIPVDPQNPWLEDFGSSATTWMPPQWSQLNGQYGYTPSAGAQWVQDDWLNQSGSGNKSAKIALWGYDRSGWLISPPINIPTQGYELKFDLGLTLRNSVNPIDPTASQDEKLLVLVSDTPIMKDTTILREYNNLGAEYVFNEIPHTGASYSIPLEGISGIKYFAFLGITSTSGGDMDLFVDNVSISEIYNPLPGTNYEFPYPITLPLVDFAGDTALYGDNYPYNSVSPPSNYLNGDDMVLSFSLDQSSMLSGHLEATTGQKLGMFIVNSVPDPLNPATVLASAFSGNGTNAYLPNTILASGTYHILISTWPNPQSAQFLLNLSAVPYVASAPAAPILLSPVGANDIPRSGFTLDWAISPSGGTPHYYDVYLSMNQANLLNGHCFQVSGTSFDPAAQGNLVFDYNQQWFWTVKAFNDLGSALQEDPASFSIRNTPPPIANFPFFEDFESTTFPPEDWYISNQDTNPLTWTRDQQRNHSPGGGASALHRFESSNFAHGWMISPAFQLPERGAYVLNFWYSNSYPTYMHSNAVWIGTSNDPSHGSWTEIWSSNNASADWVNTELSLASYLGTTIRVAFVYQGRDADHWYLDDISVLNAFPDTSPPTISHLPLLNTPNPDSAYSVTAQILEEDLHDSGVAFAKLYFSTNEGATWSPAIPLLPQAEDFVAQIPAQALGTTIRYYILAQDHEGNSVQSPLYSFTVEDPAWLRYGQDSTNYTSFTGTSFTAYLLFANPFFGSGTILRLLATDVTAFSDSQADLVIYSYDGSNLSPVHTQSVNFAARTLQTFDLSSRLVLIDTPYFFVAYENIPTTNSLLFDNDSNYQKSFVKIAGELIEVYGGDWLFGAHISGIITQETGSPVLSISLDASARPVLNWQAIQNAYAYRVWGSTDPQGNAWTELALVFNNSYTYHGNEDMMFFRVTADDGIVSAP